MKRFKFSSFFIVASILFISFINCEKNSDDDIINPSLNIVGKILKTHEGNDYFAFRGIPYAKPPISERRFNDPEPYGQWDELLDARKDGNICPQAFIENLGKFTISEDCLILNVYTPALDGNNSVIVYIHGGGFKYGTGSSLDCDPKYFLDEDIVLVTFNYRLGALGFLSSGTEHATGNYGFKDQVLVLKWIRDNIQHFGGNPNAVTLIGHSAGSISSTLHMVSPMSKNLFHNVIALSASTTHHWRGENPKWTQALADLVECPSNSNDKMIECLREKPWEEIIKASATWEENSLADLEWNVEIEKDFGQERFITKDPSVLFAKGEFHRVPIIAGTTKDEFADQGHKIVSNTDFLNKFNENFNSMAPLLYGYNFTGIHKSNQISNRLREFYFKDQKIGISTETELSDLSSDALINHGVHRLVQLASQYIDVYNYRLDYKGRYTCSFYRSDGVPFYVYHGDVLLYLFVYHSCPNIVPEFHNNDPELVMLKKFMKYITNFAKFGNPNGEVNENNGSEWIPSTKGNIKTLYINDTSKMGDPPFQNRLAVWDELFPVE